MKRENMGMWLTVNRGCNMRCKWCYASTTGFDQTSTMELGYAKKVLKFANDLDIKRMVIIGGEPTIHPNIQEIIAECNRYAMRASLITNGVKYADRRFLEELVEAGLTYTVLSLKAMNRNEYIAATGVDRFDDFLEGLENVKRLQLSHRVTFTLTEFFDGGVDNLIKLLEELSPMNVFIDIERPELDATGQRFVGGNNIPVLAEKFEELYMKLRETDLNFGVGCYLPFCKLSEKVVEQMIEDGKFGFGCHLISGKSIIIEPNGNIIPCNHMCNIPLAKFGEDFSTAEEYYRYRESDEYVNLIKRMRCAPDERCVQCKWWSLCGGSCRLRWMLPDNPLE